MKKLIENLNQFNNLMVPNFTSSLGSGNIFIRKTRMDGCISVDPAIQILYGF
jgi:hypothetical protein